MNRNFKVIPREFADQARAKIVETRYETQHLGWDVDDSERLAIICVLEIDNGAVFSGFSHTVDLPGGEESQEMPSLERRAYENALAQFVCYEWYTKTVIEHAKAQMHPIERWLIELPFVNSLFN
jgi:hypothetical protein